MAVLRTHAVVSSVTRHGVRSGIQRFERFRKATGIDTQTGETQGNTLIYTMVNKRTIYSSHSNSPPNRRTILKKWKKKFENYFIAKRNIIFDRPKFVSRSQQVGESVDSIITDLYGLERYCNFGALKEELIRDRIIVGLQNRELSEKL